MAYPGLSIDRNYSIQMNVDVVHVFFVSHVGCSHASPAGSGRAHYPIAGVFVPPPNLQTKFLFFIFLTNLGIPILLWIISLHAVCAWRSLRGPVRYDATTSSVRRRSTFSPARCRAKEKTRQTPTGNSPARIPIATRNASGTSRFIYIFFFIRNIIATRQPYATRAVQVLNIIYI